ncbi:MAG TPA: sigma-54-dependent Fis family transcriptional regulator [Vicinamibacteria bacterium]|nr:sigma-54-dependent Fis family transcriptional regulator [Vicinamibacteria bacterium]
MPRETTLDPTRPLASGLALPPNRFVALYEIGQQLLESREPGEVLRRIHESLVAHLQPDHAAILAVEGDGSLRPLSRHALDLDGPPEGWPLSHTVLRRALRDELAVLAEDVQQDAGFSGALSIQRFKIRSVLCVPLGRPPRGVVYLDNRSDRPFAPADLEFLTAVALYAALVLERAREHADARDDLDRSRARLEALEDELRRHEIVGRAPQLLSAYDMVRRFAQKGARVLLRGETGTGKELFARAYAAASPWARGPYVPVTIPALAPTLVESELFGHVKGAFTEAARDKKGRLEVADRGVLFLDEVGDVEPTVQTKLLRFLDSGELVRVGDTALRHVDALVVSATNRDLEKDVAEGRFRADLLARLGHSVTLPPLRERPGDVPLLAEHFLRRHDREGRRRLSPEAMDLLGRHGWPFNVRELQQVVERAAVLVDEDLIGPEHLPEYLRRAASRTPAASGPPGPLRAAVEDVERTHILRALEHTGGNKRRAMELLAIAPETFYRKLEQLGIKKRGP